MRRRKNDAVARSQRQTDGFLELIEKMLRLAPDQHLTFPPKPTPGDDPALQAQLISHQLLPRLMLAGADDPLADGGDFLLYQGFLLKEAGDPMDPLQRKLLRDAALGHLRIGKLHRAAALAKDRAAAEALSDQALWLSVKLRDVVVSLADCREQSARTVTPNRNASVDCAATKPAPNATSAVDAAIKETAAPAKERKRDATKRVSHGEPQGSPKTPAQRAASGNRPTKSRETRAKCNGMRTPARVRPGKSVAGKAHRTTGVKVKGPRGKKPLPATKDKKSARQLRAELDEMARWAV